MIIAGSDKGNLEFYLVKKPQITFFSKKEVLNSLKKLFKTLKSRIHFSLLQLKEKSLYNIAFTKALKVGGGSVGTLLG